MKTITKIAAIYILIPGFLLSSCNKNLFLNRKKDRSVVHTSQTEQLTSQKAASMETGRFVMSIDSSEYSYQVVIHPTETFSFSPHSGFTGSASKIIILGNQKRLSTSSDLLMEKFVETDSSVRTSQTKTEARHSSQSKVKEKKGIKIWIWGVVILVLAMAITYAFRKKL